MARTSAFKAEEAGSTPEQRTNINIYHMDYDQKYIDLTSGLNKCVDPLEKEYPNLNGFEKCVLVLRLNEYTYKEIQLKLGMPAKQLIRQALLKVNPDLISLEQTKKIRTTPELRLLGILKANNIWTFDLDEFGESSFEEKEGKLFMTDEWNDTSKFSGFDERTQKSILINIINILHLGIQI